MIVAFLQQQQEFIYGLSWFILAIGLLQNFVYVSQLPAAWLELRAHSQAEDTESSWQLLVSNIAMPISILIPAHNEDATIVANVRAMLALEYPDFEVIVANDGSKDATLACLIEEFDLKPISRAHELAVPHKPVVGVYGSDLYPRLVVLDKVNGKGKADATNACLNFSRNPLFCVVDADCVLEANALLRSVRPFMEEPKEMMAVGGTIRIVNGCKLWGGRIVSVQLPDRFLPLVQSLEYIRAFLMSRLALSRWGVLTIVSGAFGIFRRSVTVEVGGFSHNTVGEDYELVMKIHRLCRDQKRPYRMRYVPEPVCWTEAPETIKTLGNQRKRWQRGSLEVIFKHIDMVGNPRYGRIGLLGFTHAFIVDVLGPIAEVIGYILIPLFWWAGVLNTPFMCAYLALFFLFGVFISVSALILEEMELRRCPRARDLAILATVAVVENFGYRQFNNYWRVVGWWQFIRRRKEWGEMTRKGFGQA